MMQLIKTKLYDNKNLFRLYWGDTLLFQYIKNVENKIFNIKLFPKLGSYADLSDNSIPVLYLKINRSDEAAVMCMQYWLNIANFMNADIYIICDKKEIKYKLLKTLHFKNENIKFIKSIVNPLKKIIKTICSPCWEKAGYAHFTTFYHSIKNNIQNYWNIDADDTTFLCRPSISAEILQKAAKYADDNNINAFSLDMWRSRSYGKHWSFGITYQKNNIDWFKIFQSNKDCKWQKLYANQTTIYNVDFYFNYLREYSKLKIQNWYVENLYFLHWGDFFLHVIQSSLCNWKEGKLSFPIIEKIYEDKEFGIVPIHNSCIKFDVGLTKKEFLDFIHNYSCIHFYHDVTIDFFEIHNIKKRCEEYEKLKYLNHHYTRTELNDDRVI